MNAPADTIVALSSAPGPSERAVVRLSGERAWEFAASVFAPAPPKGWSWAEGALTLPGWPAAPASALAFRGPRSYTGEDLVELWVPGAPPLVRRLLLVLEERGARLADRGEFTRRAYLNDRLDLTQAEAVLTLTTSEDQRATRSALRALGGGLRARIDALKGGLLQVRAHVEAAIDFSEEELDLVPEGALAVRIESLAAGLDDLLAGEGQRPSARTQPVVALRGLANAGKSTLFNALLGREQAITSAAAGTTRDVLAGEWTLPGGRKVRLLDTAGEKEAQGEIEARALEGAAGAAQEADLVLQVVDGSEAALASPGEEGALLVLTKRDLGAPPPGAAQGVQVSALSGEGLPALGAAVEERLGGAAPATELLGTARQEGLLRRAREALGRAAGMLRGDDPARAELAAVDLAEALEELGHLTGELTTDDLLGEIFSAFCIGK